MLAGFLLAERPYADTIDQTNGPGPGPTPHGITASYWHGQTFTPNLPILTAVEIAGNGIDHPWSAGLVPGTEITATIDEANGFAGINLNLGAALGSATRSIPMAAGAGSQQWNGRFELGSIDVSARVGAPLDNGLAVTFTTGLGFGGEETVWLTEINAYTGGTGFQSNDGGATWTWDLLGPTRDLSFRTSGSSVSNSVPLPVLSITNIIVEDTVAIQFLSTSNVDYGLECTTDPTNQPWISTGWKTIGNGGPMLMFDPNGFDSNKTYRVREVGGPPGFSVMGTIVPPEYENPSLHGFTEQFPPTNTTVPSWFPNQLTRGYVPYAKNYMDTIYPRTKPDSSEFIEYASPHLRAFSAPGQYEPVTFTMYAMPGNDLTDVSVSISDLTGPGGNRITSNNVDVRLVRYWPRRVWGESAYITAPWFLEKRNTFDIAADTSQRYWLTVYVPDDTAPGIYAGTVQVHVDGHDNSALTLEFEVLDIELMTAPTKNAMYYHTRDLLDQPLLPRHTAAYLQKEIINMKEHGMNTIWITEAHGITGYVDGGGDVVYDLEPIADVVEISRDAGFGPLIWNMTTDPFLPAYDGPSPTIGKNFEGFMESYLARGWGMPVASHGDESDANGTLDAVTNYLAQSKQYAPAMDTYTTIVFPANSELYEPDLDIRAFSSWMDQSAVAPTRAAGRELWMYSGPSEWDVKANRVYRGFFGWALTLDGMNDWVYFYIVNRSLPFDDLANPDGSPNHRGWVLPGLGGPLPIPEWEGMREGIEDGNYTFTLEELIAQANASGDTGLIALAASAQAYLNSLQSQIDTGPAATFPCRNTADQLSFDFCDDARLGMANHIKALSDALAL
jgi:hypothetical protein